MRVEIGEMVDAWIETDNKDINKILDQNKAKDLYWIVLFQQTFAGTKVNYNGGKPFVRVLKAYDKKPRPLVGAHIAEVDNRRGKITWRSYPKDIPIMWDVISNQKCEEQLALNQLIYECDIPKSYIYNKPSEM